MMKISTKTSKNRWLIYLASFFLLSTTFQARAQVLISETFSTGVTPTGWTVTDVSGSGVVWQFNNPGGWLVAPGTTAMDDSFAILDSDFFGDPALTEESHLTSPTFDATVAGSYTLEFDNSFQALGGAGTPRIDVWNGSAWVTLVTYPDDVDDGFPTANHKYFDITALVAGAADAQVRFVWADGDWGYFWIVDNVTITRLDCTMPTADYDFVPDCGNNQYYVDINVYSLGDATSLNLTDGTSSMTVTAVGTYTMGPYADMSVQNITLEHTDASCNISTGDITNVCPISNDECADAIALTVNTDFACGSFLTASNIGATESIVTAPSCAWIDYDDDVWFSFVATGTAHEVSLNNILGYTDLSLALYSGTCGSLTELACNAVSVSANTLTPGETYFVRVWTNFSDVTDYSIFDICVSSPIVGSACEDPIIVGALPYSHTSSTSLYGDLFYDGEPCVGSDPYLTGDDVVYAYTATADGTIDISLEDISDDYAGIFVYGSCGDIGATCLASATNSSDSADLPIPDFTVTAGSTYYIVISTWAAPESIDYTLTITTDSIACTVPDVAASGVSICTGNTAILTATSSVPTATFEWYDAPTGGTTLSTSSTFTTPALTTTTTYYVAAIDGTCSSERLPVIVTVEDLTITATDDTVCGSGSSATFTATVSDPLATVTWYDAPTGGSVLGTGLSYTSGPITATTTFYVEATTAVCTTGRIPVTATLIDLSVTADDVSTCPGSTATLTATTSSTGTIEWYDVATGGTPLGTGATFVTPIITAATTYYVQVVEGSCTSPRIPVNITLTPAVDVAASGVDICGPTTVTLSASSTTSGATFSWYDDEFASTPVGTGATFTTPTIGATTSYWVEATAGTCTSARLEVVISYGTGTVPVVSAIASRVCISGSSTIIAGSFPSGATYHWYTDSVGGTAIFTGDTFITPSITTSTTYYVEAELLGCVSEREAITAYVVNPVVTVSDTTICNGSTASITAVSVPSGILRWYADDTTTTVLHTGATYTTPALTSTTTYYVSSTIFGCTSDRVPVTVTVLPEIDITASDMSSCFPAAFALSASSTISGATISWYDAPTGGTLLGTGSIYTTPVISTTTTYFVEASLGACTSVRIPVTVTVGEIVVTAADDTICIGSSASLIATASDPLTTISWFTVPSGGTAIATGPSFTTGALTTTTTYYVEAASASCTSTRIPVVVNVEDLTVTAVGDTICSGSSTTLTATPSDLSATTTWYDAATGGTVLGTGITYTTAALTSSTTVYVEISTATCVSSRIPVDILVEDLTITTTPDTICTGESAVISAVPSDGSATVSWYTAPSGGTPIATGSIFSAGIFASTTTYYVEATTATCTTARVPVTIMVGTPPDIAASTGATICVSGSTTLTASSSTSGATFHWFDMPTGGTELGVGASFVTPSITDTTTFYVEAHYLGCVSSRIPVDANVLSPTVDITGGDTICASGSTTLFASPSPSTAIVRWYSSPTGPLIGSGTAFGVGPLATTTTYYVTATVGSCVSPRYPIVVTVLEPPVLAVTNDTVCISGAGTLSVSSPSDTFGVTYNWYAAPTGGTSLGTGSTFTTPVVSTTTIYYVEPQIGFCTYGRTPVTVTVSNPQPIVADEYRCGPGSVTFTGTAPSGATFRWYNTAVSPTPLATGSSFTTPSLTSTRTYYVTATVDGCEGTRVPVTAEIRTIPTVSASGTSICGPGTVSLTATSTTTGATFDWYATAVGGPSLFTGATYNPMVATTTTYYVEASFNGCTSARMPVTVTVNPVPVVTATSTPVCISGTSTLTASADLSGSVIRWFATPVGGVPLATGPTYTTPVLSTTTTYYVSATLGSCTSARIPVVVTVINPAITVSGVTLCDPGSATLTATSAVPGSTIEWFTTPTGGTPVNVGSVYSTPVLAATTTFYVSGTFAGCTSARTPVTVTVRNYTFTIVNGDVCDSGTMNLEAYIDDASAVIEWYDDAALTTLLFTGNVFTTPMVTTTTVYYVVAVTPECTTNPRPVVASVHPTPFLEITPDTAMICRGDSVTFVAYDDVDYTYLWSNGVTDNEMRTNVYGEHSVHVIDQYGCENTSYAFLDTFPSPTIDGFDYFPLIFSNPYLYSFAPINAVGAVGYYWDFGDGTNSTEETPNHEYAAFGTYTVTLNIFNACDTISVSMPIFVHQTNGIEEGDLNNQVDIYPNPTNQELNIAMSSDARIDQISVYNHLGQMLIHENLNNLMRYTLSVEQLPQGSYYLLITTLDGKQAIKKFVVQ